MGVLRISFVRVLRCIVPLPALTTLLCKQRHFFGLEEIE